MVFQKKILKIYSPPPKNKLVVEKRIIDGIMRKVETYNGKVVRVYNDDWKLLEDRSEKLKITLPTPPLEPRIRPRIIQENKLDDTSPQEDIPKEESPILEIPSFTSTSEKMIPGGGLQIIPEDEVAKPVYSSDLDTDINEQLKLSTENVTNINHSNMLSNSQSAKADSLSKVLSKEEKVDAPKIEDIPKSQEIDLPKVEETLKIEGTTDSLLYQQLDKVINIQDISNKVDIPKIEPQKEVPKVEILKETPKKTNVPKETQEMGVPGVPIKKMENRIEKLIDKKTPSTTNDKTKVEDKITEVTKAEQQKKPIEDKIIKENKNMVEELLEEYKREQWAKKRDFEKNIEDMARVASENKDQIKEISQKIEGVTGKIEGVTGKVGEVEEKIGGLQDNIQERFGTIQERFGTLQERLGDMKKPVTETLGELCTGVDCIKTDLKKSQEHQQSYQQTLEKQLEGKFGELSERLQKLEEPSYVCDNCGQDGIKVLASFCPNCGSPIHSWTDPETGNPVSGWIPYWKRMRGTAE